MGAPYHFKQTVRLDTIWTHFSRFPVRYGTGYLIYYLLMIMKLTKIE